MSEEGLFIVGNKYKAIEKIDNGSFGSIYIGVNINTGNNVAIKLEENKEYSQLENEAKMYNCLRGKDGMPELKAYGKGNDYKYLVINLLGSSIEKKMKELGGRICLKLTLAIGIQMLKRVEILHNCGIIHRDLKPDNFLFGLDKKECVYLIDFGLATAYKQNNIHIKQKKGSLIGTKRFSSVNVSLGITPSRRDDIESIGYILIYLLKGELPWDKNDEDKYLFNLWDISIPREISLLIEYSRKLKFEEKPKYNYLKTLLENLHSILQ